MFKSFQTYLLYFIIFSACNVGLQSPEEAYQTANSAFEYWEDSEVYADSNVVQIYTQCEGLQASKKDVLEVLMEKTSNTPKNRQVVQRNIDCLMETIRRSKTPNGNHECNFQVLIDRSGNVVAVRLLDNPALPIANKLVACIQSYQYEPLAKGPCLETRPLKIQLDLSRLINHY